MYQNKRILPPPTKRGRVGYYGDEHRSRLRMVAALQDRGFSLAAIKETLDSWDAGASVDELIGTSTALPGLGAQEYVQLTTAELTGRFDDGSLTAAHVRRAGEIGLVRFEGSKLLVSRTFLDAGAALVALGVSVDEVIDEFAAMHGDMTNIVGRFVDLFDRHLWQPFIDAGKPAGEYGALADQVAELADMAKKIVLITLDQELTARAEERLAELS